MIKELSEFGKPICEKKYGEWNHVALKEETISIEIVIDNDGSFKRFETIEKIPTIAESLTSKKGSARLLLDKAEEVLCYGGKASQKKHSLFLSKLALFQHVPCVSSVVAFYGENKVSGLDKALIDFEKAVPEKSRGGNIGFRIQLEGVRLHEKPEVRGEVIAVYESNKKNASRKKCSVCEKNDYPVEDEPHGMIKNVPNGKTSGCALVSYNAPAFESYSLKGNDNSTICANCARTYVEGLSSLLSDGMKFKNKKNKDDILYANRWPRKRSANFGLDTAILFWTRNNKDLPEIDQLEAPNADEVAKMIASVTSGNVNDTKYLEMEQFYSCSLSGAAARIAVRDWIETSLGEFKNSIAEWFKDISIGECDDQKKIVTHYASLYELARSCQRRSGDGYDKDDTSLARIASSLWKAAIQNQPIPLWILTKVLQRARLDKSGSKYGVTAERAGLIKLILNRINKGKGDGFMITENIAQGERPVAYVCGQVFAKMESIQYAALGEKNAGIRERYFTYAMTLPAAAFGRLFDLSAKHYRKLKNERPGRAVNLDKELQDLVKDVDINKLPATFSLEEKGHFAIGYYHQKQAQFAGINHKKEKQQ